MQILAIGHQFYTTYTVAAIAYGCSRLHGIERAIRDMRVEVRVNSGELQP